jgi:hypothetical protein
MPNFDPLNDRLDVYSAAMTALAEINAQTIFNRTLAAGAGITLTPNANGTITVSSASGGGGSADGNLVVGSFGGSAPSSGTGQNGDYALDTSDGYIYGPKASGAWPSTAAYLPADGIMQVGAYSGVAPANSVGKNADYAFDTASGKVFGPKASGAWPSTPAFVPDTVSLVQNGYIKLPGGFILQWGLVSWSPQETNGTYGPYTFPVTFPNACLNLAFTTWTTDFSDGSAQVNSANPPTASQFYIALNDFGPNFYQTPGTYWMAIGY